MKEKYIEWLTRNFDNKIDILKIKKKECTNLLVNWINYSGVRSLVKQFKIPFHFVDIFLILIKNPNGKNFIIVQVTQKKCL